MDDAEESEKGWKGIITPELVEKHTPDHGLVWIYGGRTRIVKEAARRSMVDKDSEIRYLRFVIINKKQSYQKISMNRQQELMFQYAWSTE